MYNIVVLDSKTLGSVNLEVFKKLGNVSIYETTDDSETMQRIANQDIVITNKVKITKGHMLNVRTLKLICITATGTNNIDLVSAKKLGIVVKNVKGYSTNSVCENTFAMLFYLQKKIKQVDDYTKSGSWCNSDIFNQIIEIKELYNKTWGIIGLGEIGRQVAKAASVFGCKVIYYSSSNNKYDVGYDNVSLDELLTSSDIISIHAPLNDKTANLLSYEQLNMLKNGVFIMNMSRGGIINENDMAKILDERDIYHATDVLYKEPMEKNHPYLNVKNGHRLLVSAHIAWSSKESRDTLLKITFDNIKEFIKEYK